MFALQAITAEEVARRMVHVPAGRFGWDDERHADVDRQLDDLPEDRVTVVRGDICDERLVEQLLGRGRRVRAIVRSPGKLPHGLGNHPKYPGNGQPGTGLSRR